MQVEVREKEEAAREAVELMEIYRGKLTRVQKELKEEMENEDDEAYIEITLPLPLSLM